MPNSSNFRKPILKGALLTVVGLASTLVAPAYADGLVNFGSSIPAVYGVLACTIVGGSAGFTQLFKGASDGISS